MKINKNINVRLIFSDTSADIFLACAIFQYIYDIDNDLEDYIGYDENEITNNNDFLYVYNDSNLEIKSKIEKYIIEFENKFNLVKDCLEKKIENNEINDSDEFYEQFSQLYKIVNDKKKLMKNLNK